MFHGGIEKDSGILGLGLWFIEWGFKGGLGVAQGLEVLVGFAHSVLKPLLGW